MSHQKVDLYKTLLLNLAVKLRARFFRGLLPKTQRGEKVTHTVDSIVAEEMSSSEEDNSDF